MSEEDLFDEVREHWRRRHHHRRRHVSVLLGYNTTQGVVMAEQVLDVSPPVVTVDAALGSVRDVNGNVVIDPVASGTWTADNSLVGSVAAATDGTLNAVVTLTETAGTLNVAFSGTTASGASVAGAGQIVVTTSVAPSGAVSVDVTLTAVVPLATA